MQPRDMLTFQELVPPLSEELRFFGSTVVWSNTVASSSYFSTCMWLVLRGVAGVKYTPDSKDVERKKKTFY